MLTKGIVSLSPALTEVVFALGKGSELVGVTTRCDYPPEAKKLPKLTDLRVNYEAIVRAHPKIVLADMTVTTPEEVNRLWDFGIEVMQFHPTSLKETAHMIRVLGQRLGAADRAEALAAPLERSGLRSGMPLRVVFTLGADGLWVAGNRTIAGDIVRYGGGINVTADQTRFYQASKEALLLKNPQVIVTVGPVSDFMNDPTWKGCTAVKKGLVFQVDPDLYNRPGPRLAKGMDEMLQRLTEAMVPVGMPR
jgi:iron complex transport system substrate-binding protein